MSLHNKLVEYSKSDYYPFHMPGHKRQNLGDGLESVRLDITEIEGFDNLNSPSGIINEMNEQIASLYNSEKSFFTVNGSTCGNLAAVHAVCNRGETIVIARNCHKSVYNACKLRGLSVEYIVSRDFNECFLGEVTLEDVKSKVEELIENENVPKAVLITSPTYEGVVSPVGDIAKYLHSKGIALIVDMAHGAHFAFHKAFPEVDLREIDVCIMSAHKTLPVMNQGSIVHVNSNIVDSSKVAKYISIFQTSSPSYIIIASMSKALEILNEKHNGYVKCLEEFYENSEKLKHLTVENQNTISRDISKIIIYTNGYMSGFELADILREKYKLEFEMAEEKYILAMTSCMDTKEGFLRLEKALKEIDASLKGRKIEDNLRRKSAFPICKHEKVMEIYEAEEQLELGNVEEVDITAAKNKISLATVMAYPPGIPLVVPGERITESDIDYVMNNISQSGKINGLNGSKIIIFS